MSESRPRTPGMIYAALVVMLLVLMATFALTARQPPPPTIAEFAPQSVENITDAPTDQSSSAGRGAGECSAGQACGGSGGVQEPTPAPPPPIDVARVRRCVGDPPRQIEDPQSPPCVPFFAGDNGGATAKGVTASEIRIAWPVSSTDNTEFQEAIMRFFNTRFEFYGRKMVLKPMKIEGSGDAATTLSYAVKADEELNAFASLTYSQDHSKGGQGTYYDELARRKIVSSSFLPNYQEAGHLERFAPYQWQHYPSLASFGKQQGEWMCNALAGRPAEFAGAGTVGRQRVFGLIHEKASNNSDARPNMAALRERLRACDVKFAVDLPSDGSASAGQSIMIQMRTHDPPVTSILCVCDGSSTYGTTYMKTATGQQYFPEWLTSNYTYTDQSFNVRAFYPQEQSAHLFGLSFANKYLRDENMPMRWASQEAGSDSDGGGYNIGYYSYANMLQIASGIQMAGPRLTPQTFEDGMFKARFPNPGCKAEPFFQACVDYAPGDHVMQEDGHFIWWSNTFREQGSFVGAFCYVNQGRRYGPGEYPSSTDGGFFGADCQDT